MVLKKRTFNVGGEEVELPMAFNRKNGVIAVLIIIGLILLFSGFYTVGPDEQGVIQRFGKYTRTTESGLHMKMPFGVESVRKVKVKYVFKEEFGFRTLKAGVRTIYSNKQYTDESLMLTGDLNLAVVEWIVQFKVKDARDYIFNVRNADETLRDISEAVMREVVGDHSVTEVLTTGRIDIANKVEERLQSILDYYKSGINIVTVKLQDVNPPDIVKPAFNDVNEARQEKERMINQAWQAYNKAIPQAKGEAKQRIQAAEGYALNRINRAQGDAANFIAVWKAYRNAKDVTRKRLYLETLTEVLPRVNKKYIIDIDQKGILPFLDLQKEQKGGVK
ncbi:FtsH protease activity modulator HflK [bacterium]|nr:FtsH protease activity modulator HflK [bacterium]